MLKVTEKQEEEALPLFAISLPFFYEEAQRVAFKQHFSRELIPPWRQKDAKKGKWLVTSFKVWLLGENWCTVWYYAVDSSDFASVFFGIVVIFSQTGNLSLARCSRHKVGRTCQIFGFSVLFFSITRRGRPLFPYVVSRAFSTIWFFFFRQMQTLFQGWLTDTIFYFYSLLLFQLRFTVRHSVCVWSGSRPERKTEKIQICREKQCSHHM